MKYFDISTIKTSIERLEMVSANWLLPSFVFAANDIGVDSFVDMSKKLGTDQFLDRYFSGARVGIPPTAKGNNLLRPRLKGIAWDRGVFAGDYMIRQDTKMWGNLFSSRGYREMRLQGLIEGEKAVTKLTASFQPQFETEIPQGFLFEDLLVWIFAFEGVPDQVSSWSELMQFLLHEHLNLENFKPPYRNRFKIMQPELPWPPLLDERLSNETYLQELSPKLYAYLSAPKSSGKVEEEPKSKVSQDDPIYSSIRSMIDNGSGLAFLLAGPPGTGKTRYARSIAEDISQMNSARSIFLQFHPAISYDDFIEGFRPKYSEEDGRVKYELSKRIFLNFADSARRDPKNKYVMVIDELNRGDVARIFGEVLTYIESDYRNTEFTLPYSGERVSIPDNLILIATANPYDRSVIDLDDALLRRFWVFEMEPDKAVLQNHLETEGVEESICKRTIQLFTILNEVFPFGYGHSSFLGVKNISDLSAIWMGRIRPALKRTLLHDKDTYLTIEGEVENLLKIRGDEPDYIGGEHE